MNTLRQILILFLFLISIKSFSQVSNYTFSETVGTYTSIVGGTQLGTTTSGAQTFNNGVDNIILPIGSRFSFNGSLITSVNMSYDGSLWLNPSTTTIGFNITGPITSNAVASGVISAMGMDLRSTSITTQVCERRWQDVGTEVVFQWQNVARAASQATERFSFQIRINKSTGVVSVVYGNMTTIANSTTYQPQVGLRGTTNVDFNNRRLTLTIPDGTPNWGAPNGTTLGTSNAHTVRFTRTASSNCFPALGLTFIWTPPSCFIPINLTSSSVTSTTSTISWTAPSPAPASYDYFLSTTNVAPTAGTTPTGNITSTSVNLTSLTPDTRYYWWVRSNCGGTQTTWVGSANFYTGIPTCTNTNQYPPTPTSTSFDNTSIMIDNCNFQEDYAVVSGIVAGNTYQFGYSLGGWITIRINTFNGTAVIAGNAPLTWTATISGNVFVHYNTDDFCSTATICGTSTVTCTSCPPPIPGCTNIYQYITANAPTTNIPLVLTTFQWQDEFNQINNVVGGNTYESSYSLGGFITIRVGAYNGSVVASGNSPLTWTAPSSGTYYIHYNTDNSCNNATINGTSILTCTSCAGVPPTNDLICNAISINCNTSTNGTTIDATNTGTGENQTCGYIQTQPGVWYVIDGDGGTMIASLCNTTTWDSKISIFSGTNCNNTTCFSGNDDAIDCGGIEASDTFTTVINRKYFILVHGYNSNDNFTLNVSCRPDLLPIKWKSFNGETDNEINYLRWVTEMEEDTDYFEVEKSKNGIDFESISIINAANNSLTDKTYNYNDENPYIGQNYYRIKLYNLDGSVEYSNIIVLNISNNNKYHIYPNPFDNTIIYSYSNNRLENLSIEIINLLGQTIYSKLETSTNKLVISLNELIPGNYKIRIRHLDRNYVIEEFIIKK